MSRQSRAGSETRVVGIRATGAERKLWERAARAVKAPTLSDAIRPAITEWATGVLARKERR